MGELKAAADSVDLRPAAGQWMTGYARRVEPAIGTHDPIMARAVLLDDGYCRLAIISCDLLGFSSAVVADIRQAIAATASIPADNILICCTHTHSGPASMPMRGVMGHVDADWLAATQSNIVRLVSRLPARLQPARFAFGCIRVPHIAFNRQDDSHDIDEDLAVISVEAHTGSPIATMVQYAAHPVILGPRNLEYSGDYPGATARHLERLRGGIGLYLQGASGDAEPENQRERGWGLGTFEDVERVGKRLAEAGIAALSDAARTSEVTLAVASTPLDLPLDPPPAREELAALVREWEAQRHSALQNGSDPAAVGIADAMLAWARELEQALAIRGVPTSLKIELFVAGINDVRLIAVPLEPYGDIALRVKRGLRPLKTVFLGYANGLYGYCASRWAKEQGGYGPAQACRWFGGQLTAIGFGADEILIAESIRLAGDLKRNSQRS
jgi:neutral ceramidase